MSFFSRVDRFHTFKTMMDPVLQRRKSLMGKGWVLDEDALLIWNKIHSTFYCHIQLKGTNENTYKKKDSQVMEKITTCRVCISATI